MNIPMITCINNKYTYIAIHMKYIVDIIFCFVDNSYHRIPKVNNTNTQRDEGQNSK